MKEHNISRIHSIRHPSPANTHQSLCAHNLITKHITAAKQPRCSDALLLMQAKIPQLFLLLKTCQLEDCGGVRRVVGTLFLLLLQLLYPGRIFASQQQYAFPGLSYSSFSAPLCLAQHCTKTTEGRDLVRAGQTDLPLSANYECDLVNSPQRLTFPLQKSGCTRPEYCLPAEEPFRHSAIKTLTLMALGWLPH